MKLYKKLSLKGAEELCKLWCTLGVNTCYEYYGAYTDEMKNELRDAVIEYMSPNNNYVNLLNIVDKGMIYSVSPTSYPIITSKK